MQRRSESVSEAHDGTGPGPRPLALHRRRGRPDDEAQAAEREHPRRLPGDPLAYDTLPTREQLTERAKSGNSQEATHAARILGRLDEKGTIPADYPYPVQVTRLGDELTWVTLGGEVVVDYSLRLKKEIDDPIVWVSGYSNDVMAYIPSLRVWKEGGYEGGDAMKWGSHPTRWSEHTEDQIIATVQELRRSLNP